MRVIIFGAGYVGLTLGIAAAKAGHQVYFIDTNDAIVENLNNRKATFFEEGLQKCLDEFFLYESKIAYNNIDEFFETHIICDTIYIVSLGTPLNDNKKTEFGPIEAVISDILKYYSNNDLIILRSTVAVGTSNQILKNYPILENLSFCPERTIEGKALEELSSLPQIISGNNSWSIKRAEEFFSTITRDIIKVSNIETAELIKLASNSFRDLNFAFANLLALIAERFNVNVHELISLANFRYNRNQIAMPGLVGGPCLEKDSYILAQSLEIEEINFLKNARSLNENIINEAINFIKKIGLDKSTNVIILGAAFKGRPLTADTRGSFIFRLIDKLIELGIENHNITIIDPKVNEQINGISVFDKIENKNINFKFSIQLTNHELFESEYFNNYLLSNCEHIISFWPKNRILDNSKRRNLFLGGLID